MTSCYVLARRSTKLWPRFPTCTAFEAGTLLLVSAFATASKSELIDVENQSCPLQLVYNYGSRNPQSQIIQSMVYNYGKSHTINGYIIFNYGKSPPFFHLWFPVDFPFFVNPLTCGNFLWPFSIANC